MARIFKHLTFIDRRKIEKLLEEKQRPKEIAKVLRVHLSTIYREMERGKWYRTDTHLKEHKSYSADLAEQRYRTNLAAKGVMLKIANDYEYALYIEHKIADEKYSPAAVLGEIEAKHLPFKTSVCFKTLYNYIDKNVFARITNQDLPEREKRRKRYRRVRVKQHKRLLGESIEKRPENVAERETFGHWEMDTVKGKIGSKASLLVLTERKTRKEIITKLEQHSAQAVVDALDELEKKHPKDFSKIFKTITCDNGTEFSYAKEIERSALNGKKRTKLYYCHPYTSWERGSNETANKMIRRFIPKGRSFDNISLIEVKRIENWMNHYPRKIHKYMSAEALYLKEMKLLE